MSRRLGDFTYQVERLRPHPKNYRDHDLDFLQQCLEEDGQHRTIVVRPDDPAEPLAGGTVLAGHGVFYVTRDRLKLGTIHATAVECTDLEAERVVVRDNRANERGRDDPARLLAILEPAAERGELAGLGYTEGDLQQLVDQLAEQYKPGGRDPDETPEAEPITQPGDLWLLGRHRLLCGDATRAEALRELVGGRMVPLAITSFPYAVGLDYGATYTDDVAGLRRLLGHVPAAVEYWPAFRSAGWLLHTRRVWAKPHARVSAPWTASSNRAATDWEHVWTWKKPGRGDWEHVWTWKKPGKGLNQRREPSYFGVWDSTHWEGVGVGKESHPAAFPVGLAAILMRIYSNRRQAVLDPMAGTGTTIIAAEREARTGLALEISPGYCDIICARFEQQTGTVPVLERTGEARSFLEVAA